MVISAYKDCGASMNIVSDPIKVHHCISAEVSLKTDSSLEIPRVKEHDPERNIFKPAFAAFLNSHTSSNRSTETCNTGLIRTTTVQTYHLEPEKLQVH